MVNGRKELLTRLADKEGEFFVLISACTREPYVECDEETFDDEVFLFLDEEEAKKEAMIREAEGKAQAIAEVQKATAEGLKYLNEAAPTESVLTLKSLEAFEKASDGQATKIIIPSEIQGIAGLAKSVIETCKEK